MYLFNNLINKNMTKNKINSSSQKVFNISIMSAVMFSVLSILAIGKVSAQTYSTITSQLDFGDRGTNVTNLQAFLSSNTTIYPSQLVTGYFGTLTRQAVMNYQATYGLSQAGRVGPLTLTKINQQILAGGIMKTDIDAPIFNTVSQSVNKDQATFTFYTNEATTAYAAYSTSPLSFNEGDINSVGFSVLSGQTTNTTSSLNTYQTVTISNLNPNTTYYYTLVAKDAKGNVSVWGVHNKFTTTQ